MATAKLQADWNYFCVQLLCAYNDLGLISLIFGVSTVAVIDYRVKLQVWVVLEKEEEKNLFHSQLGDLIFEINVFWIIVLGKVSRLNAKRNYVIDEWFLILNKAECKDAEVKLHPSWSETKAKVNFGVFSWSTMNQYHITNYKALLLIQPLIIISPNQLIKHGQRSKRIFWKVESSC